MKTHFSGAYTGIKLTIGERDNNEGVHKLVQSVCPDGTDLLLSLKR